MSDEITLERVREIIRTPGSMTDAVELWAGAMLCLSRIDFLEKERDILTMNVAILEERLCHYRTALEHYSDRKNWQRTMDDLESADWYFGDGHHGYDVAEEALRNAPRDCP